MSKEAKRVTTQIQKNELKNIVTKVTVNNLKEFQSCFEKVKDTCPDTVIMLVSDAPVTKKQTSKLLWVAAYVPERVHEELMGWINDSTNSIICDGEVALREISPRSTVIEIVYPDGSECVPFKLVDVINGTAFSILRKKGLIEEESSEEEMGFDDIADF
jgi:hypothetical protein